VRGKFRAFLFLVSSLTLKLPKTNRILHCRTILGQNKKWAFIACCVGQLGSLLLTGGCILTQWEKRARGIGSGDTYAATFLQQYLPFLPEWFPDTVPLLTLAALVGAAVQIVLAVKRRRTSSG
jgi:hypothetical protein